MAKLLLGVRQKKYRYTIKSVNIWTTVADKNFRFANTYVDLRVFCNYRRLRRRRH